MRVRRIINEIFKAKQFELMIMQQDNAIIFRHHMICDVCGIDLGTPRLYWAEEHLKKYPKHLSYTETKVRV